MRKASKAEEIARKYFPPTVIEGLSLGRKAAYEQGIMKVSLAIGEALEWAAQQCGKRCCTKSGNMECHRNDAAAIRTGKSAER